MSFYFQMYFNMSIAMHNWDTQLSDFTLPSTVFENERSPPLNVATIHSTNGQSAFVFTPKLTRKEIDFCF